MRPVGLITALLLGFCFRLPATIYTVTNTNDSGVGSFRQALTDSGVDTIRFNLPGPPPYTIAPANALPSITVPLMIDGTSQPGYSGRPVIELAGNMAGAGVDGLVIAAGGSTVQGLAINRFSGYGIYIFGDGGDTIQGNFIGTDVTGSTSLPNGQSAILIFDCPDNIIGGLVTGARNLLSGRNRGAIYITGNNATGNQMMGNLIGTDATGLLPLGSALNGVLISDAPLNVIGGTVPAARNIISANGQSGVYITGGGAFSNVVQGNFIGLDITGTHSLSNASDGVTIYGASSNLIGGTLAGARNVISGNGHEGVYITNGTANIIQGNLVGTDVFGTNALANRFSGVALDNVSGNLIGGTASAARNLLSGNGQSGVRIFGSGASNNLVQGNFIGTDSSGTLSVSNGYDGVTIEMAHANTIGGATPGAGNVISGNVLFGVYIATTNLPGNILQGNFIGTDALGVTALPNRNSGVGIYGAPGNAIGGTNTGAGNLISGNNLHGLYLTNSSGNTIQGNFIGSDQSGTQPLGNDSVGLFLSGSHSNLVGGSVPGARNVFADNFDCGVYVLLSSSNQIQGNFIGTDLSGSSPLPNFDGVFIDRGSSNLVGGTTLGAGNLLSGNLDVGVNISGSTARSNKVQGNFIGTAPDGISRLINQQHAVQIDLGASFNSIGGVGLNEGNVIAYSTLAGYDGVRVQPALSGGPAVGNLIAGNSILGQLGTADSLGIDLETDGVTANDLGDADTGANNQQNFPVLTLASNSPGQTIIQGTLNSIANKSYRIEFFASPACNGSGSGDGQSFLGALTATTAANGNVAFTNVIPWAVPAGYVITATATDPANNTSEFSACQTVVGASVSSDLRVTATATPNPVPLGGNLTWQITVQNFGPDLAYGLKLVEVLPSGADFASASPAPVFRFGNTLTFNLGTLTNGGSLIVSIIVTPTVTGGLTNNVSITSAVPDSSPGDNHATSSFFVTGPSLTIERSASSVAISWPAFLQNFQLEAADDPAPAGWNSVPTASVPNGNRQTVTEGISGSPRFYRLRRPF